MAGRTALLRLLPFSLAELLQRPMQGFWKNFKAVKHFQKPDFTLQQILFQGLYPRIHDQQLDPTQWYRDYFETYVSRDVRELIQLGEYRTFERFLAMLAGRSGQLINFTSLGNDVGVSHTTVRRWLSVLETSFIVTTLNPHFENFNKRLVKACKVYFLDTGLLCFLLRVQNTEQLVNHPQIGAIFETFVIAEMLKHYYHQAQLPPLYFWRDHQGHEVDLLLDLGRNCFPIEIKSAQTLSHHFLEGLKKWCELAGKTPAQGALVYGGDEYQTRQGMQVIPWYGVG